MSSSWLRGWAYRKKITLSNSGASAYPADGVLRVIAYYGSGTDGGSPGTAVVYLGGKCRSDFGDVRFTGSDGVTTLYQWLEEKTDGSYAIFWVRVPVSIAAGGSTYIYIYYGNPGAALVSDDKNTFAWGQDFRDSKPLDANRFTEMATGVSGGSYAATEDGLLITGTTASTVSYMCIYAWMVNTQSAKIVCKYKLGNADSYGGFGAKSDTIIRAGKGIRIHGAPGATPYIYFYCDGVATTTSYRVQADPTAWHKHVLKLSLSTTATGRWEMDGATQYENTNLNLEIDIANPYLAGGTRGIESGVEVSIVIAYLLAAPYLDPDYGVSVGSEETAAKRYALELSEAVAGADRTPKLPSAAKGESEALADYLLKLASALKPESGRLADALARAASAVRGEAARVQDAAATLYAGFRAYQEPVALTDAASKLAAAAKAEAGALADALTAVYRGYRVYREAARLVEAAAKAAAAGALDAAALADAVEALKVLVEALGESLEAADYVLRTYYGAAVFAESGALEDAAATVLAAIRELAESGGLSDASVKVASAVKSESSGLAEALSKQVAASKPEAGKLADALTMIYKGYRVYQEAGALADYAVKMASARKGEAAYVVDAVYRSITFSRAYADAAKMLDSVEWRTAYFYREIRLDAARLSDHVLAAYAPQGAYLQSLGQVLGSALVPALLVGLPLATALRKEERIKREKAVVERIRVSSEEELEEALKRIERKYGVKPKKILIAD